MNVTTHVREKISGEWRGGETQNFLGAVEHFWQKLGKHDQQC